ncbi:beta-L-arabinofuranosidase domain-containing protein [Brachybacterium sacelli]|uniref:Glycosyl hydrolase n=1 Tax=Brachybacterium sacelli TaxID=173364 RepID=A0ABS4X6N1_9MICO|nr:beta-L-arabinofuranosidase domain-containing protein [Brachybacterium sacelli]MBP2384124.1 hypothetical protein [Brachybacterium sacelli]
MMLPQPRLHQAATTLPPGAIRPRGWLERQLRLQAEGITGRLQEIWPDVGPDSGWLGGPGEDWERGPYYLDGLVPLAHALGDQGLIAKARPWIEWMLASQRADGFFGPDRNEDWWPRMVAAKVLVQHADATGDERVAPFLLRWHRYQHEHLPSRPLSDWGRARGAEDVLTIAWTFRATGQEWLLELAALVQEQTFDWNQYLTTDLITGQAQVFTHSTHGVNVAQGLKTGATAHLLDGDPAHRERTEAALANLERWHGQAHGWFSGDEWLGGREATAGIETCLVVEMMHTAGTLSRIFGDAVHGDRLESLALNLLPASSDPRMRAHQYHQQGTQIEASVARRNWSYSSDDANVFGLEPHFGCCTANLHQGWPKFATSLWARDTDGGLRAVAYAPAEIRADSGGTPVTITVETEYPFEETVRLRVEAVDGGARFPLRLRIPTWCEQPELTVDGVRVPARPGPDGHVELARDWAGTTLVALTLPMRARILRRERQAAAVHLGPLVMVASPGETWTAVPEAPGLGEWEIHPRTTWNWALTDLEDAPRWRVGRGAVPEAPFALGEATWLEATGCRVRAWEKDGASADVPPAGPVLDHGPVHTFRLVPYGTARLRVMEFPVAGAWRSAGNEQEF